MSDDVARLHSIIDQRIDLRLGGAPSVEVVRGQVASIVSTALAMVRLDGSSTPTPVSTPRLPVTLAVDDEVVVLRRRDGLLVVALVL